MGGKVGFNLKRRKIRSQRETRVYLAPYHTLPRRGEGKRMGWKRVIYFAEWCVRMAQPCSMLLRLVGWLEVEGMKSDICALEKIAR